MQQLKWNGSNIMLMVYLDVTLLVVLVKTATSCYV